MVRRLAAILVADVVGYSRLMGEDEGGTLAALKAHREELIEPQIASHHGRIVKLLGDGMLVEFPSVVEAMQCAVEVQAGMAQRNANVPDSRRMLLRMGINVGDVLIEGDDIYGDGVNVAARLESLAEPGGICVRRAVRNQVRDKLPLAFEDMGEIEVKNIARPIRTFRVLLNAAEPRKSEARPESKLPDKPSIAVLPFANMTGDPEQEYFTDGITEDIITELSRFRSLFVIARNSSFTYKGRSVDVQEVGRQLRVQYVVEGSVRRAGGRVRITVQLVEARTGNHLWAERYERDLEDIFSVQDEVTQRIVANLVGRLDDAGRERALRKPSESLSAYDLWLQGKYLLNRRSKDDILHARKLFQRALDLDPNYATAYIELAETYIYESTSDWTQEPDIAAKHAFDLARTAVELDDRDSRAHLILAWAYFRVKSNFDLAASQLETAIALNPNDYYNYCFKSWFLTCKGDPDGGILCANEALRRNPLVPDGCLYSIGFADYLAGRYEEALATFGKMSVPHLEVQACIAACYGEIGRTEDARAAAEEFRHRAKSELAIYPATDTESWRAYWLRLMPFKDAAKLDHLLEGLRKAGLPE